MTAIALEMVVPGLMGFGSTVGKRMRTWIATLRNRGLVAQLSGLGLAVLVVYAVVAPVAAGISGLLGLAASATADSPK